MLQTIGDDAQCKGLHLRCGGLTRVTISHDAGQIYHLGQPPAVVLALDLDSHDPLASRWKSEDKRTRTGVGVSRSEARLDSAVASAPSNFEFRPSNVIRRTAPHALPHSHRLPAHAGRETPRPDARPRAVRALVIRGGSGVTEQGLTERAIGIADGRIVAVEPAIEGAAAAEIDAAELHVLPGVIDTHVHFKRSGRASRAARPRWPSAAAPTSSTRRSTPRRRRSTVRAST